jgi:hypothetical protein
MVDFDQVNANNKKEFLNASIRNMEEMLDEVSYGLELARDRQVTFIKTGDLNTSEYEATKIMIEDLEKEYAFYIKKLSELRKERAEI